MSAGALAVVLAAALVGIAVVLNHVLARISLLEVALNEGMPPGHERRASAIANASFSNARAREALGEGVHIFVSRGCHACQRLLDELDERGAGSLADSGAVLLRCVDRPRPIVAAVAARIGATVLLDQQPMTEALAIDPLPHCVAIGARGLVAHAATPSVSRLLETARDAGIQAAIGPTSVR